MFHNLKHGLHKFLRFVENLCQTEYVDGCRMVDLFAEFSRAMELMGLQDSRANWN